MSASCEFTLTLKVTGATVTPDINSGAVAYFGMSFPAGTYRIDYVSGAMKYNPAQGWALNATDLSPASYFAVRCSLGNVPFVGTTSTNFPSQAAVEAANSGASTTIAHAGGPIGMVLLDTLYDDNVSGNPNPTFGIVSL